MSPPPPPSPTTTTTQWPTTTTTQWPTTTIQQQPSATYAATGKIMLASITTLVAVVVILLFLHLYSRWHLLRHRRRRSRRRSHNGGALPSALAGGLDGAVLKSIPVVVFSSPEDEGGSPECAVCLSEFEDGEKCRKLNECKHCFHVECIDVWFCGNSTCPLCRSPVVVSGEPEVAILVDPPESSPEVSFPVVETASFADTTKRVDVISR